MEKPARKKTVPKKRPLTEIGWAEIADLPDLGLSGIHAKIDTGARTSSLHATRIRTFERDGEQWVKFHFQPGPKQHRDVEAPLLERRKVTSSNGKAQERYVIKTTLKLGKQVRQTEITLTNRGSMAFPMLIGRKSLRRAFIVNVGRKFMLGT